METFLQYHFIGMTDPVSLTANYTNFSIGDENSGFALNYNIYMDKFDNAKNPNRKRGKEIFQNDRPRRFCAPADPNCACATTKSASWWYGSDCLSEFPLTALSPEDLEIPVDGTPLHLSLATMTFYPYYFYK
ncbi:uncharacterized protein LOC121368089 [Gigantopelta aegis]|uniref:uncharacterized protein LOC121368089 n=1 Tax=Gigantopelta aegis TaxID=1735272 RepID=UPI001B88D98A|nr:uncharacterized protein LOC121368089 [Gigantopelta aegis]